MLTSVNFFCENVEVEQEGANLIRRVRRGGVNLAILAVNSVYEQLVGVMLFTVCFYLKCLVLPIHFHLFIKLSNGSLLFGVVYYYRDEFVYIYAKDYFISAKCI